MEFRWIFLLAGFLVHLVAFSEGIDCGSHFTSRSGSFSSPGYPKQYSDNLFCVWTVRVSGSNPEIKLTFSKFELPPKSVDGECTDFVSIYSGSAPSENKLIGKYCGPETPSPVLVNEHVVYVQFFSNGDQITASGFVISFSTSTSTSSITTSQATAGIVAAIFCGIVFLGVGAMRCVMMGACQRCQAEQPDGRECIGTNETVSNYVMDCPPSYRTVMEHPERYPTPNISPHVSPTSTPRISHEPIEPEDDDDDEGEPPPPYSRVIPAGTDVQQTQSTNQQRTIPVNDNTCNNDLEMVTVHNNPLSSDDEREGESNVRTSSERTERTSANRRSSYNIASSENPVLSADCDPGNPNDMEPENADNGNNSPGTSTGEGDMGASSGSLSVMDQNNEMIHNCDDHDVECCNSRVDMSEDQRNGYVTVTRGSSPKRNSSTQTNEVNRGSSSGHNVWL